MVLTGSPTTSSGSFLRIVVVVAAVAAAAAVSVFELEGAVAVAVAVTVALVASTPVANSGPGSKVCVIVPVSSDE